MDTYSVELRIRVTVEAPSEDDALEAIEDCFGDCGGVMVEDLEILDIESN